jgi:hypothetical protein
MSHKYFLSDHKVINFFRSIMNEKYMPQHMQIQTQQDHSQATIIHVSTHQ